MVDSKNFKWHSGEASIQSIRYSAAVWRILAILAVVAGACVQGGCAIMPPSAPSVWAARLADLQSVSAWQFSGRAAAQLGGEGWQASLDWRQSDAASALHLSGPLGIGALNVHYSSEGLRVDGLAPGDSAEDFVIARLGFAPPFATLRYWLLGVPAPSTAFELAMNSVDRAQRLTQDGWTIEYTRYARVGRDLLPDRISLQRQTTRARIAIDHWEMQP
jgi:outer membrane lipoprotein LolB